jgi:hypothetical protein
MTKAAILARLNEAEAALHEVRLAVEELPEEPGNPEDSWWAAHEWEQQEWIRFSQKLLEELGGDTGLSPAEICALTSEGVQEPNFLSRTLIAMREE